MLSNRVYLVRSTLAADFETVQRKDDISLSFDTEPSEALVAARLTCVLLGEEPACTDVSALEFTRIA